MNKPNPRTDRPTAETEMQWHDHLADMPSAELLDLTEELERTVGTLRSTVYLGQAYKQLAARGLTPRAHRFEGGKS